MRLHTKPDSAILYSEDLSEESREAGFAGILNFLIEHTVVSGRCDNYDIYLTADQLRGLAEMMAAWTVLRDIEGREKP